MGICASGVLMAQEKDSRGKDFWFTFIPNLHVNNPETDSLYIYVAASEPTNGTLRYKGRNGIWRTIVINIPDPAKVFTYRVYWYDIELQGDTESNGQNSSGNQAEAVAENVFNVSTDKDVTVYALNQASTTSDAFLVLPTDALGKDHYVLSYNSHRNGSVASTGNTPSQFAIVATEDNTEITINPSAPTSKRSSSNPILTILNQGETFLVQASMTVGDGSGDMTGTRVQSTKPIALFSGHQRAIIPIKNSELSSRDHIVEQLPSVDTWGRTAIVVPFPKPFNATNLSQDIYRVLAAYDSTDVLINGVKTTTLSKGGMYQSVLTTPQVISSNKAIMVAQYKKTSGTQNSFNTDYNGDPFMMLVPPSDQFQDNYRFVSIQAVNVLNGGITMQQGYDEQWITLVMPNSAVSTTRLDGQQIGIIPGVTITAIPGTNYSYAWIRVIDGVHAVTSNERVGIYVYGYGRANSYGYVGGMSFRSFDFNPPQITGKQNCRDFIGTIYDTVAGDSRIVQVFQEPSSAKNIKSVDYSFIPPQDSVMFKVLLDDPYQDGSVTITALDSVQQKTTLPIRIKGFTVSSSYKLAHGDSIQVFTEKTPVGKQICYDISLENYGSFDQDIAPYFTKSTGSPFSISGPQKITLKPKQTFTFQVCFNAPVEGTYLDSLYMEDVCSGRALATFAITAYTDKQKPTIKNNIDSCGTCHVLFIADSGATDGGLKQVKITSPTNVQWQNQAPQTDAVRALSICVQDVYKDAMYEVLAEDKNGNVSVYSDTIPGFTISSNSVGKVKYMGGKPIGSMFCDTIVFVNTGLFVQVINEVRLSKNIVFSVPRSAFPLRLAPGASANVPVCYAPTEIIDTLYDIKRDRDTISIGRNCITLPFAYEAFGVQDTLIANGRCDVTVKTSVIDLSLKRIGNVNIAPHPISYGSLRSLLTFSMRESKSMSVRFIEALSGKEEILFSSHQVPGGDYAVSVNMHGFAPGMHVIVIQSDDEQEILPVIITD